MNWHSIGNFFSKKFENLIIVDFGSTTTDFVCIKNSKIVNDGFNDFTRLSEQYKFVEGSNIPPKIIEIYDNNKEYTPRPHFLSDWLKHPAGTVLALVDGNRQCHGFGRIRPCLLSNGEGWRIGPLIADKPEYAQILLRRLLSKHPGFIYIDSPGLNPLCKKLFYNMGFTNHSYTVRMYKGQLPHISLSDIYGLACLELG